MASLRHGKQPGFPRLFRGQKTELWIRCRLVEETLEQLSPSEKKNPGAEECRHWLERAQRAISHWWTLYSDYGIAWGSLLEIRHEFCRLLPAKMLVRSALDIRNELEYINDAARKDTYQKEIDDLIDRLVPKPNPADEKKRRARTGKTDFHKLKDDLRELSLITGNARQWEWYKVNLYRSRLFVTALLLLLAEFLLVAGLIEFPAVFGMETASRLAVLGVLGFGCIGGFLSGLLRQEPMSGPGAEFYMAHQSIFLQPIVGAAAGLVTYIAQLAGVVTIGPHPASTATYFFVAFCSGFSERYFVAQLSPLSGGGKDKKDKKSKDAA